MKPAPASEMTTDDLLELALQVSGAAPTVDAGDLGPDHVRALCSLVTSLAQDLSQSRDDVAVWHSTAERNSEARLKTQRDLDAATVNCASAALERDRLAAQLEQARRAIADREDEIARTNNLRQAEALDAGEQRQRADNAEAAAEVFEATARAALALVTRPGTVDLAELVRAVDGRLSRALVREKTIAAALGNKLEETLRLLEEHQQTAAHNDQLHSAFAGACEAVTGQTVARVNLQLDAELAAHPDVGPLHHARDQREDGGV